MWDTCSPGHLLAPTNYIYPSTQRNSNRNLALNSDINNLTLTLTQIATITLYLTFAFRTFAGGHYPQPTALYNTRILPSIEDRGQTDRVTMNASDCSTLLILTLTTTFTFTWRHGVVVSGVSRMNEINPRRARIVLGWATVFGRVYHLGM